MTSLRNCLANTSKELGLIRSNIVDIEETVLEGNYCKTCDSTSSFDSRIQDFDLILQTLDALELYVGALAREVSSDLTVYHGAALEVITLSKMKNRLNHESADHLFLERTDAPPEIKLFD